jgi:hypothetical protein
MFNDRNDSDTSLEFLDIVYVLRGARGIFGYLFLNLNGRLNNPFYCVCVCV